MIYEILITGLLSMGLGIFIWSLILIIVRNNNLDVSGRLPTRPIVNPEAEGRLSEIKYHNEAIYRDFEYFYKTTAALLGGVAYLVTQANQQLKVATLIELTSAIHVITTIAVTFFILAHQKSKIERWTTFFKMKSIFLWQETWMISVMWFIAGAYTFSVIPRLIK
jgi:hypothetical protein